MTEKELSEIVRSAKIVTVIGIKGEAGEAAHDIPVMLQERGIKIVPINPKLPNVLGEKCFVSIKDVPVSADVVNVFRRSEAVEAHADEVLALPADRRPKVFWMQTGIRNEKAAEKLEKAGIKVVMDKCLGVYAARYLKKTS